MPTWLLKAMSQKSLASVPYAEALNRAVKTHVLRAYRLDDAVVSSRIDAALRHDAAYRAQPSARPMPRVLEIGTGAFPIVPLVLRLLGSGPVTTVDVQPLVTRATLRATLDALSTTARDGDLARRLPDMNERRLGALLSVAAGTELDPRDALGRLGVDYRIGETMGVVPPRPTFDLAVSYAVLEYIRRPAMPTFAASLGGLVRESGVLSHWIDLSDEYSYFDRRISRLNFLRYPDHVWGWLDNPFCRNDRLRLPDYRGALGKAGFTVKTEDVVDLNASERSGVRLARRFNGISPSDVYALSAWIVAIKRSAATVEARHAA